MYQQFVCRVKGILEPSEDQKNIGVSYIPKFSNMTSWTTEGQ
jgi:hypothetical protein